jgi:hypothetical protein
MKVCAGKTGCLEAAAGSSCRCARMSPDPRNCRVFGRPCRQTGNPVKGMAGGLKPAAGPCSIRNSGDIGDDAGRTGQGVRPGMGTTQFRRAQTAGKIAHHRLIRHDLGFRRQAAERRWWSSDQSTVRTQRRFCCSCSQRQTVHSGKRQRQKRTARSGPFGFCMLLLGHLPRMHRSIQED